MGSLADIAITINRTSEAVRRLERALLRAPGDEGLVANLSSLLHTRSQLEEQFRMAAASAEMDVCQYRVFSMNGRETVRGFANSLALFQRLYSLVYDALRYGPKQRGTLSEGVTDKTDFGFAYSSTGSIVATLTLPNERLLVDTELDHAIQTLFSVAALRNATDIAPYAAKLGAAPVAALYQWAEAHADAAVGADIRWQRESLTRSALFMSDHDMRALIEALSKGSDPITDEREVFGTLEGINIAAGTFQLQVGKQAIKGKLELDNPFDIDNTVEVPARYAARIRTVTRELYAKGEKEVAHTLVHIQRMP